jgi:undecaprenyl diphosphate synthase
LHNKINHIAIIMDGNQRWAEKNNKKISEGYSEGLKKLLEIIDVLINKNIQNLSVYALSTENIKRPNINLIYDLIRLKSKKLIDKLIKDKRVRIRMIGERNNIPNDILKIFEDAEKVPVIDISLNLNIAFNYGTNGELIHIVKQSLLKKYRVEEITTETIRSFMFLKDTPDPDILVRTGGFRRLSNFLLLNLKYTELFFTKTLWPDLNISELDDILNEYQNIERKYGL